MRTIAMCLALMGLTIGGCAQQAAPPTVSISDIALDAAAAPLPADPAPAPEIPFGGQSAAIAAYEALVAAGGWSPVPAGPTLEPGAVDDRVAALRARLEASGDHQGPADDAAIYDPLLVAAVERFQRRHGLAVDGVVGPATLRNLNVSAEARLTQLRRAQARAERLAAGLGERFVLVNLPAFELRYVRHGEVRHTAAVIIGSRDNQTVEFSDEIDHLIFNPYWNVPASIAREELITDFRDDPAKMAAKGFKAIDAEGRAIEPTAVDWSTVPASRLPYRFRQGPGAGNALGQVKFMFPNQHAIYLHDTPSRSLFARADRALSHGCIRVQDPLTLAERLLEVDGHDRGAIDGWVDDGANRRVQLARPVPVHLVYLTAWRDADGTVQFREDVYGREVAYAAAF